MGCRFIDAQEHNVRFDIPAAQKVFESDIPITVIPGDLCSRYKMNSNQIKRLDSPMGDYVKDMALGFMGIHITKELMHNRTSDFPEINKLIGKGDNYGGSVYFSFKEMFDINERVKLGLKGRLALDAMKKIDRLTVNLNDSYNAAFEMQGYFDQYNELIDFFKNQQFKIENDDHVVDMLESFKPKSLSIADIYIPFCYLNPSDLKIETANVEISSYGVSVKKPGEKHKIVRDIDWNGFKKYIKKYLR